MNAHTYAIWNITNRAYYKRTKYQSCNLLQKVEATIPLDDKATHFYFEPKITISEFCVFPEETAFSKVTKSQFTAGSLLYAKMHYT